MSRGRRTLAEYGSAYQEQIVAQLRPGAVVKEAMSKGPKRASGNPPASAQASQSPAPRPKAAKVGGSAKAGGPDRASSGKCGPFTFSLWADLPVPIKELRFAPPRRWRFDYAWPAAKVALEVEGGIWTGGRHTRGKGFLGDMEKYNTATVMGWRVLRVTPDQLKRREHLPLLIILLECLP